MKYKIFEANGTEIENIDEAEFNNFLASGKSGVIPGVLNECAVLSPESSSISVSTGLLLIHGFRIKILSPFTFGASPSGAKIDLYIIARVTLSSDRSVQFDMSVRTSNNLIQDSLFQTEQGIYEVEIAKFSTDITGIIDINQTIKNI